MEETSPQLPAAAAGTIDVGGDLTVNRLGFGAMRVTGRGVWGDPPDREEAKAVLRRVVELGVNFIDTADSYGPEVSEALIAEALAPYPDDLVIATKGGLERSGPGQWPVNGHPDHLREACEGSLRRLGLEQIPLYQLHRPDPKVPLDDSLGALVELKEQGKIRHIGLSNCQRASAPTGRAADPDRVDPEPLQRRRPRIRGPGRPVRAGADHVPAVGADPGPRRGQGTVRQIAERHGASPTQVVLAWLLARSPAILPIPGTGSLGHLEENVAAAALELTGEEVAELNREGGR